METYEWNENGHKRRVRRLGGELVVESSIGEVDGEEIWLEGDVPPAVSREILRLAARIEELEAERSIDFGEHEPTALPAASD